ncbi:hypothetical protein sos41_19390 [Alphaproteobacteria bacterium SO-S41]|nr:hypothetical protein sos41_19390 [Alphaproteobacteria bacterium SO-S41]
MTTINGTAGADNLADTDGSDLIHGREADDIVTRNSILQPGQNDKVYGDDGNDIIAASFTVQGIRGIATVELRGGFGDDRISASYATASNVGIELYIAGDEGNDVLFLGSQGGAASGGSGNDLIYLSTASYPAASASGFLITLGTGADTIIVDHGDPISLLQPPEPRIVVNDFTRDDRLDLSGYFRTLTNTDGSNSFTSGHARVVTEPDGKVSLQVDLDGAAGPANFITFLQFTGGVDAARVSVGDLTNIHLVVSEVMGTLNADTLTGTAADENLKGLLGNDDINGGAGNDRIWGGGGGDRLTGGAGADVFVYSLQSDSTPVVYSTPTDYDYITDFATGIDRLDFTDLNPLSVSLIRSGSATFAFLETFAGKMTIALEGVVNGNDIDAGSNIPIYMIGTSAADTLIGSDRGDPIYGGGGADTIIGGGGADTLFGEAGADTFRYLATWDSNATGSDGLFGFETGLDKIDLNALEATSVSLIRSGGSTFLFAEAPSGGFQLAAINADINGNDILHTGNYGIYIIGDAAANTIIGSSNADSISGGGGNDVITGGGGADVLFGDAGADIFRYLSTSDSAVSAADTLYGFTAGSDKVDLTAVRTGANDSFGIAYSGGASFLFVDIGGNGTNDMLIQFAGATITAADILWSGSSAAPHHIAELAAPTFAAMPDAVDLMDLGLTRHAFVQPAYGELVTL